MAAEIVANMKDDVIYVIGPGTTTRSIMQRLELPYTLLGVDVVLNKQILANDVNEQQLYDLVKGKKVHIVVTAIGGQGHIFGRGNQQISPRIIRAAGKENITVVASRDKLTSIMPRPLLVDTGDPELDRELSGYYRIVAGWQDILIYKAGLE